MHGKKSCNTSVEGGKAVGGTVENASANVNESHEARRLVYNCARSNFSSTIWSFLFSIEVLEMFIFRMKNNKIITAG
jgi:hypothetical protein